MQSLDCGYCTIYSPEVLEGQVAKTFTVRGINFNVTFDAAAEYYTLDGGKNIESAKQNYICKTHYTYAIPDAGGIAPKIYLWGDPLDHAYLTTRLWAGERENPDFLLTADNFFFRDRVEQHFDRLESWLDRIVNLPNAVRYEHLVFGYFWREIARIEIYLQEKLKEKFKLLFDFPEICKHRIVYSGWRNKIDTPVARYIEKRFDKYIW